MIWWKYFLLSSLFFGGIYSFESSYGFDPLMFYSDNLYLNSISGYKKSKAFKDSVDVAYSEVKLDKDDVLVKRADSMLVEIDKNYKLLADKNFFGSHPYSDYLIGRKKNADTELKEGYREPVCGVNIYGLSKPIAYSFPDGTIFLSRSIVDGDRVFSVKNDAQYMALLIHEYIHVQHMHLLYRWGLASSINKFLEEKRRPIWMYLLQVLPVAYKKTIYSTRDLSGVVFVDFYFECLADFNTALILGFMGYDVNEYIGYLLNKRQYINSLNKSSYKDAELLGLDARVLFLRQFMKPDIGEVKYMIVRNKNGRMLTFQIDNNLLYQRYAAYWYQVFIFTGADVTVNSYMFYADGDLNKPLGYFKAVVFPDNIIEIPVFSFVN